MDASWQRHGSPRVRGVFPALFSRLRGDTIPAKFETIFLRHIRSVRGGKRKKKTPAARSCRSLLASNENKQLIPHLSE